MKAPSKANKKCLDGHFLYNVNLNKPVANYKYTILWGYRFVGIAHYYFTLGWDGFFLINSNREEVSSSY